MKRRAMSGVVRAGWCLVACCALAGCTQNSGPDHKEAPTTQPIEAAAPPTVDAFMEAQARKGAQADDTLYKAHFDGDRLNSLGRSKLGLLAQDHEAGRPMVVYLDLPAERDVPQVRDSITRFLASAGVPAADVQLKAGPNPDLAYPASETLKGIAKTDSDYTSQSSAGGYGASGSMTPSGGGGSSGGGGYSSK